MIIPAPTGPSPLRPRFPSGTRWQCGHLRSSDDAGLAVEVRGGARVLAVRCGSCSRWFVWRPRSGAVRGGTWSLVSYRRFRALNTAFEAQRAAAIENQGPPMIDYQGTGVSAPPESELQPNGNPSNGGAT